MNMGTGIAITAIWVGTGVAVSLGAAYESFGFAAIATIVVAVASKA